jgi:hypothetical protein
MNSRRPEGSMAGSSSVEMAHTRPAQLQPKSRVLCGFAGTHTKRHLDSHRNRHASDFCAGGGKNLA